MRPMSDLKALSQNLMVMSTTHNVPFSNLIYEVLRGMLISVAQRPGLQTLKVDAFVMIKLPLLLEKLYHLHLKQVRSTFVRPLIFLFVPKANCAEYGIVATTIRIRTFPPKSAVARSRNLPTS